MTNLKENITKIHITILGKKRIKNNLNLENNIDCVEFVKNIILKDETSITKIGKNYYCQYQNIKIVINSFSYTIITAHLI